MTTLLLATRNQHKTREFAAILGNDFSVCDLSRLEKISPIEETGCTFAENATLKAVAISKIMQELVVADDSGLEVQALEGAPGIFSARYAGVSASDAENIAKLLRSLDGNENRRARFRCVIAVARAGEQLATFDGAVEGKIMLAPRGQNGFGYDPIFVPAGFEKTFSELGDETKNQISHRARAIVQLLEYLRS